MDPLGLIHKTSVWRDRLNEATFAGDGTGIIGG